MRGTVHPTIQIFLSVFKIGAFTIGGGYAMLPLMEREFVEKRRWISHDEILDVFAASQSLPGVIAINTSVFIGYRVAGIAGAVCAIVGVALPSFLIILALASVLLVVRDNALVQRAFAGVRAGVAALIFLTAINMGKKVIGTPLSWTIAILSFVAIVVFEIHAILVIVAAILVGFGRFLIARASKP